MSFSSPGSVHFQRLLEQSGWQENARDAELFEVLRPDSGWLEHADHSAIWTDTLSVEDEDLVHTHDVLLHAGDLGDVDHLATPVTQARDLNDKGNGRSDLVSDRPFGHIHIGHRNHRFEPGQG